MMSATNFWPTCTLEGGCSSFSFWGEPNRSGRRTRRPGACPRQVRIVLRGRKHMRRGSVAHVLEEEGAVRSWAAYIRHVTENWSSR